MSLGSDSNIISLIFDLWFEKHIYRATSIAMKYNILKCNKGKGYQSKSDLVVSLGAVILQVLL